MSGSAWAVEVKTHNGDRLSGEIVKMEDGALILDTEYGQMRLRANGTTEHRREGRTEWQSGWPRSLPPLEKGEAPFVNADRR